MVIRQSQQKPRMWTPSELLHSAQSVFGLGLSSGTANAAVGGIVCNNQKSGLRGLPAAAHLSHHVETQPTPHLPPPAEGTGSTHP